MSKPAKSQIEIRKSASGETAYVSRSRIRVVDVVRLYQLTQEQLIIERMRLSLPTLTEVQLAEAIAYWREHPEDIAAQMAEEDRIIASIPVAG